MNCSLVLGGGAARGAFSLGVLQYLDEVGIKVQKISGTSIGAIIGASYSAGVSPKEQLKIYGSKEFKKIIKLNLLRGSVLTIDRNASILKKLLNNKKNFKDLNIPLSVTTFDIKDAKKIEFEDGELIPILLGSSALTPLFKPVPYKTHYLIDGGFVDNLPVQAVQKLDLPIIGINLQPLSDYNHHRQSVFKTLKRTIKTALFHSSYRNDQVCDYTITSKELLGYSLFSFKKLEKMFDLGYEEAKKSLAEFKEI